MFVEVGHDIVSTEAIAWISIRWNAVPTEVWVYMKGLPETYFVLRDRDAELFLHFIRSRSGAPFGYLNLNPKEAL